MFAFAPLSIAILNVVLRDGVGQGETAVVAGKNTGRPELEQTARVRIPGLSQRESSQRSGGRRWNGCHLELNFDGNSRSSSPSCSLPSATSPQGFIRRQRGFPNGLTGPGRTGPRSAEASF